MAVRSIYRGLRKNNLLLPLRNMGSHLHSHAISFGFKEVREEDKSQLVGDVFTKVASNYDLMNDLMSGGLGDDKSLVWVEGDAEALKFEDNSMDGYTIAFGIRNVTHIEKALSEAHRVLKRGGRFLCLELSHVELPIFKDLYDYYSFSVIPALGDLVAGDRGSYQCWLRAFAVFPHKINLRK
ncbi:hypothetical protein ACS0TY_023283 [Phlomoides rotata]